MYRISISYRAALNFSIGPLVSQGYEKRNPNLEIAEKSSLGIKGHCRLWRGKRREPRRWRAPNLWSGGSDENSEECGHTEVRVEYLCFLFISAPIYSCHNFSPHGIPGRRRAAPRRQLKFATVPIFQPRLPASLQLVSIKAELRGVQRSQWRPAPRTVDQVNETSDMSLLASNYTFKCLICQISNWNERIL